LVIKEFRSEIGAVGPNYGAEFSVDPNALEEFGISKRLEHRAPELAREIDLSCGAICEPQPKGVTRNMADFSNGTHTYSKGGIGLSAWRSCASFQSSSSSA
jgi:hypothetical protein